MNDFMLDWNSVIAYRNPLDPDDDPNYGVLIKISDVRNVLFFKTKINTFYYSTTIPQRLKQRECIIDRSARRNCVGQKA